MSIADQVAMLRDRLDAAGAAWLENESSATSSGAMLMSEAAFVAGYLDSLAAHLAEQDKAGGAS